MSEYACFISRLDVVSAIKPGFSFIIILSKVLVVHICCFRFYLFDIGTNLSELVSVFLRHIKWTHGDNVSWSVIVKTEVFSAAYCEHFSTHVHQQHQCFYCQNFGVCVTKHVLSNAVTGWEELVLYDLFFELTGMLNFNSINESVVCDCSLW